MNRHRSYWPLDDAPGPDGEGAFVGLNALDDPGSLADGEVADSLNARFDHGTPETRGGIRIMSWAGNYQSGDDPALTRPFGEVLAGGTFSDPISGFEWQVIVTASGAWRVRPGNLATPIPVASGESLLNAVDVVQTFDGLILLRGRSERPLRMETFAAGFQPLPDPQSGKTAIPPCGQAIYFSNRLFAVDGRLGSKYVDSVWVSDIGGVSSVLQGADFYQNFRINQGSADRLVGVYKFNDTTLVAAKERSIYVVFNIVGTNDELALNAKGDEVTKQYGCLAPRSFVQVGDDIWFLGHRRGICSIKQTEQNKLQGVDVPVSRKVQPLIDRINWERASGVVAETHDNRVYFAVPIDDSEFNNAVLVYSTLTSNWAGLDMGAAVNVRKWIKFSYGGGVRIGFVSNDGFVCLYEDGEYDDTGTAEGVITHNHITSRVLSRGYGGRISGSKHFGRLTIGLRTSNPTISIRVRMDGFEETSDVAAITKSRTRYDRPYGTPAWDPTNVNDDWANPGREDYSIVPGFTLHEGSGPRLNTMQHSEEPFSLSEQGQYAQVEIECTTGRMEVAGIAVEATRGDTSDGSRT